MKVAKWGNSLAIRLPVDAVQALGLKDGDEVEISVSNDRHLMLARKTTPAAIAWNLTLRFWSAMRRACAPLKR